MERIAEVGSSESTHASSIIVDARSVSGRRTGLFQILQMMKPTGMTGVPRYWWLHQLRIPEIFCYSDIDVYKIIRKWIKRETELSGKKWKELVIWVHWNQPPHHPPHALPEPPLAGGTCHRRPLRRDYPTALLGLPCWKEESATEAHIVLGWFPGALSGRSLCLLDSFPIYIIS